MKCQSCGKKQATIKYTESINGIKQELHLCDSCSKKFGISGFNEIFIPMFVNIPEYEVIPTLECKYCGNRLEDYSKTGMFGCSECYTTFENTLDELFYKIHGKNRHVNINADKSNGKNGNKSKEKIFELKEKLKKLVEEEKYEEAAIIRDEIKKIEGGN